MADFFALVWGSPGLIAGPLMMLGGLVAVAMCVRATRRPDRAPAMWALRWSSVPPAVGVVAALVGAALWVFFGMGDADPARGRMALFCTILFGVFCAIVPFLWSLILLQRRPTALA